MRLQDLVTRHAERRPAAIAIVHGAERLSYGELDAASNRLARVLREAGCRPGDRVCFLAPRSIAPLVWMLGILKAGAIHVALDAASPALRLARIVAACEPRVVLASGPCEPLVADLLHAARMAGLHRAPLIGWLDDDAPRTIPAAIRPADLQLAHDGPMPVVARAEDPSHILFTSGSTGMPKGVVITHANVLAFVDWANAHFGVTESDRLSGHTPLHFDLSTYDVFGSYAAGAELHLVPTHAALLPARLAQFIRESGLTQWFSVPSVLNYMAKAGAVRRDDFPSLRRVLWCGEALPVPALIHWMQNVPHARYTNLYGPTETTIASSYHDVDACPAASERLPIGRACAREELLVVDGEICIAGAGLSPGYWRDPARTAAAFVPHPARPGERLYRTGDLGRQRHDGLFELIGRADTQIKSRGYRIELGEIEAALAALGSLRESAVVAVPSEGFEQWSLCCAFVPMPEERPTAAALRSALARRIPAYMLPMRWRAYAALPRNANGKIDRPQLMADFRPREEPCPSPQPTFASLPTN